MKISTKLLFYVTKRWITHKKKLIHK